MLTFVGKAFAVNRVFHSLTHRLWLLLLGLCVLQFPETSHAALVRCDHSRTVFVSSLMGVGLGVLSSALIYTSAAERVQLARLVGRGGAYGAGAGATVGALGLTFSQCLEEGDGPDGRGLQPLKPIVRIDDYKNDVGLFEQETFSLGVNFSYVF